MTTELRVVSTPDITASNDVLKVEGAGLPVGQVAAASWIAARTPRVEALTVALESVFRRIRIVLPEHTIWLLAGSSAWQLDNRIVRYHKLWGALKARGIDVPTSGRLAEVTVERDAKLKFFGAVQVFDASIGSVVQLLLHERCAYLVAVPNQFDIQGLLDEGWIGDLAADSDLILRLSGGGGVLFKSVGEFDDLEKGLVSIGKPFLIDQLARVS